jgi:hypothetical protein
MANNIIEKLKIAELDPNKTYFLQICIDNLNTEAFQHVYKVLTEKFEEYGIKNIMLFTPPEAEVKFTEIGDKND